MYVEVKTPEKVAKKGQKVIGAKVIKTDDVEQTIVAIKDGANTIIKILDDFDDVVVEIVEKGTSIYRKIADFFDDIFNTLPTEIHKKGKAYRLVLMPARGKNIDTVLYVNFWDDVSTNGKTDLYSGNYDVLYQSEAKTMFKAKNTMHQLLEKEGII